MIAHPNGTRVRVTNGLANGLTATIRGQRQPYNTPIYTLRFDDGAIRDGYYPQDLELINDTTDPPDNPHWYTPPPIYPTSSGNRFTVHRILDDPGAIDDADDATGMYTIADNATGRYYDFIDDDFTIEYVLITATNLNTGRANIHVFRHTNYPTTDRHITPEITP